MAPTPLLSSLGSYFTPADKYRHAIVSTSDGEIHEVFYNPNGVIGNTKLATFCGVQFLTAFYTADDELQHPVVSTSTSDIFEVSYGTGTFKVSKSLANFPGTVAMSGFYAGNDKKRIVIVATSDGAIHELFYDSAGNTSITEPPLANFAGLTHLAAFYTDDDQYRHVIVATANGNITEVYYSPAIGVHISAPPLANFQNIVSLSAFYAANDKTRIVIVATADGKIHEIFYSSALGIHVTQPALASFPGVTGITAFYTPDDQNRHVIVTDSSGKVTEVFYSSAHGVHITNPPLATFGLPSPQLEYAGPDVTNLNQAAIASAAYSSPAGRCVALAGNVARLHGYSDTGGVWGSTNNGGWTLEAGSPAPSMRDAGSVQAIAVSPSDSSRLLAVNVSGIWQTANGGSSWIRLLDPTTILAASSTANSVVFDAGGRCFVGLDGGVGVQQAANGSFNFVNLGETINAVVVSESKVWARSMGSLYVSTDHGATWSIPIPISPQFSFKQKDQFVLAATDGFAFLISQTPGSYPQNLNGCAQNNVLVIYNAGTGAWSSQIVQSTDKEAWETARNVPKPESNTCDGSGGDSEILGRRFLKCIRLLDATLVDAVGQRIQLIFGSGQEIWRADAQNNDGTITDWNWALGTTGKGFTNRDPVHADIYDFHMDTEAGGRTAWVACDGGIYSTTVTAGNYQFSGNTWKPATIGLHTHQIQCMTVLRVNQASQPRIAYVIGDNSAFYRDTTATVLPFAQWQSDSDFGDGNFCVGDSSAPSFAWLARQLTVEEFLTFGKVPQPVRLINPKPGSFIDPSHPTRFRFIPSPWQAGQFTGADVVMMVDLPLLDANGALLPNQPGASSNGLPVLIRNRTYDLNPDMNTSKGAGWTLERATLPALCLGFAVSGSRSQPVYYAFADDGNLYAEVNGEWTAVLREVISSQTFGPVFPNPYDKNVVYALTSEGVQVSGAAGANFQLDKNLNALLGSNPQDVNQMSFNYDNPSSVVVGTESGKLLFSPGNGNWKDLSFLLPPVPISIRSVAIDCEAIYIGTFGRGLWRVTHYG